MLIEEDSANVTKIAVLDTGLHFDIDIAVNYDGRAESYCFLDDGQEPRPLEGDEDGHGTHLASITLDIGVSCKVYSARIARHREDFQDTKSSKDILERIARVSISWSRIRTDLAADLTGYQTCCRQLARRYHIHVFRLLISVNDHLRSHQVCP
jgi:hypothetical protein